MRFGFRAQMEVSSFGLGFYGRKYLNLKIEVLGNHWSLLDHEASWDPCSAGFGRCGQSVPMCFENLGVSQKQCYVILEAMRNPCIPRLPLLINPIWAKKAHIIKTLVLPGPFPKSPRSQDVQTLNPTGL